MNAEIKSNYVLTLSQDREKPRSYYWFRELGELLKSKELTDEKFRWIMNRNNFGENGLWNKRPPELLILDEIHQEWPHTETVGNHTNTVIQNLRTNRPLNGFNYFTKKPDMIKVVRLSVILHDISKINNPADIKHPEKSASMVKQYLDWVGFNDAEKELCLKLIAHHDLMGKVANRREKEDINDILKIFNTPAQLQCLYEITIADISSIPGIRNIPGIMDNLHWIYINSQKKLVEKQSHRKKLFFY